MDDKLIYTKTAAGELAMRERTRLIQRNLRMVLILVEGQTSVAALKDKVNDDNVVETALAELEQMGLIAPLPPKRRRSAVPTEPQDIVIDPVPTQPQVSLGRDVDAISQSTIPTQPPREYATLFDAGAARSDFAPVTGSDFSRRAITADDAFSDAGVSAPPANNGRKPWQQANADAPNLFARIRQNRLFRFLNKEERDFERAYHDDEPDNSVRIRRVRRGRRGLLTWPLRLALGLIAVVLLLAAAAALFPFDRYRPQIEAAAARTLRSPVKIESVHFAFSPYPSLVLERVVVGGAEPYAWVERARMVPDILAVFSSATVIRSIEVEAMRVGAFGLDRCTRWLSTGSDDFQLRRLVIDRLGVDLGGTSLEGWSGEAVFRPQGSLAKFLLTSADKNFRVEAEPSGNLYRLSISGSAWTIPLHGGLAVSSIEAKGELTMQQLRIPKLVGEVFDGLVEGSGTFDWSDGASLVGDLELKHGSMGRLSATFDPDLSFEGDVDGNARLETRARNPSGLLDGLHLDGSFTINHAVLNHFDFVEAVRSPNRDPIRSGSTRVDQLTGKLQCDENACRVNNVKMASGLMRADGRMSIARKDRKLDGLLDVELRGSASSISAPVSIAGTLDRPELLRR